MPAAAYVFGHNHRAERLDLPDSPTAAHLNTGDLRHEVRGPGPDQLDRRLFSFVRLRATTDGVDADLHFWRHPGEEGPSGAPDGRSGPLTAAQDDGLNRVAPLVQSPVAARRGAE